MTSDQANLGDTQRLRVLGDTLGRLPGQVARALDDIGIDAGARVRRIERAATSARDDVRDAERAYQAATNEDSEGSWAAVEEARERLRRLEDGVEQIRRALSRYKIAARELSNAGHGVIAGAKAYMDERITAANQYLAIQVAPGISSDQARASVEGAGLAPTLEPIETTSLPLGFGWIPIGEVDETEITATKLEWAKGISRADMQIGLTAFLRDILPVLQKNPMATRDDFVALDRELDRVTSGSIRPDNLANLYDVFFGTSAIAASRLRDGRWSITNGRHRIALARELGWKHVPGRLLGDQLR